MCVLGLVASFLGEASSVTAVQNKQKIGCTTPGLEKKSSFPLPKADGKLRQGVLCRNQPVLAKWGTRGLS